MDKYDMIVIGFGKAGKTLAGKYAAEGKTVAVIEKDDNMYGGTCINVGCIPSKTLVRYSQSAMRHPDRAFEEKAKFYQKAIMEKRRVTSMLRDKNFHKLDDLELVTLIHGEASFTAPHRLEVRQNGLILELEGEKIIINTGASPVILPIPGVENHPFIYTSASLMDLPELPRRLIIVGGGYIGLEFASMYSGFGSEVTVLQDGKTLIPREDRDIAEAIQASLESKGVTFCLGAEIHSITADGPCASVHFDWNGKPHLLQGEAVLLATGRKPNTAALRLENAGIKTSARGAIAVDENLRTSVPDIWAVGDVNGGQQFTYVSLDDSRIVWSGLHGGSYNREARKAVPYSVFLSPTYSRVGLNEQEAEAAGYNVKISRLPVSAIPKAHVLGKTTGLLKAVIDRNTDKILGAMLFCEDSHEMINIVKLAMDLDAPYQLLRDQIFTHPTMSESLNDLFAN